MTIFEDLEKCYAADPAVCLWFFFFLSFFFQQQFLMTRSPFKTNPLGSYNVWLDSFHEFSKSLSFPQILLRLSSLSSKYHIIRISLLYPVRLSLSALSFYLSVCARPFFWPCLSGYQFSAAIPQLLNPTIDCLGSGIVHFGSRISTEFFPIQFPFCDEKCGLL